MYIYIVIMQYQSKRILVKIPDLKSDYRYSTNTDNNGFSRGGMTKGIRQYIPMNVERLVQAGYNKAGVSIACLPSRNKRKELKY